MNSQINVLVVDDEETVRKLLRSRLERENFRVHTAENVDQALVNLAHDSQISVIVTDIRMPGKSGIDLLKEIKSTHPEKKVVVMTGHAEKSTAIEALRNGASNYLEKPFDMEEMVHSVHRAAKEFSLEMGTTHNTPEEVSNVIPLFGRNTPANESSTESFNFTKLKKEWTAQFEREYLQKILAKHGGNVTAAAKESGLDRSNFLRLLRRHHMSAQEFRKAA